MPETRSSGAGAGSKRQQQSLPNASQKKAKGTPSTQTVYTEEDFLVKNYRDWGLSDTALRRISKFMVGEPVGSRKFSESELKAAGYTSWTQYQVHAALTAW
ncbi:hypothetical protein WJX79_000053 [Trebouxia sp. C0005]